ncbi:S1C family serine protease [Streptomyces sp. NBC_00286]|uniref:S1C family serine protease n=1 Tax=Streptomyces sp. NBC_00286 TaxID=2975701 RepID=UPI002E2BBB79|nr:trypsin-like peptidase domain-containing protein [Streptomyces sp. NBC_00286]
MTESFRRNGEYPQGEQQQQSAYSQQEHATSQQEPPAFAGPSAGSPVNPEWPPPPAHEPPTHNPAPPYEPTHNTASTHDPMHNAASAHEPAYSAAPTHDPSQPAATPTALLNEPVSAGAHRRGRARGPLALLAAVAIAAAAVGGGTAYAFQELSGNDTGVTTSSTANVVPTAQKGTVAGVAQAVSPSIVEINATSAVGESTGSGVIITGDGEIITNNHVVSGADSIKVRTSDGKSYSAEVVGTDSKKDLALIKLKDASGMKAATLGNSDGVKVGDQVVAIGSPEGLTGTVTSGIISALDRDVTVSTEQDQGQGQGGGNGQWPFGFGGQEFNGDTGSSTTTYKALQTDASLNPGNSGGALIDMNGNIIGINSAMYSPASATSANAGSAGLGFAIPINTVKSDLNTLRAGGSDN